MEIISRLTAVILTLVLSPLLIGISICNLLLQGRPIIFRQKRIGKDFKPFILNIIVHNYIIRVYIPEIEY